MPTYFFNFEKINDMGLVYAEITLINGEDLTLAKRHIIGEEEVKQMNVNILVDSGAMLGAVLFFIETLSNVFFFNDCKCSS